VAVAVVGLVSLAIAVGVRDVAALGRTSPGRAWLCVLTTLAHP
jgi:hypothetical protein